MEPNGKVLYINYEKCTGCRLCELVCSVVHDGVSNPARSRIRVMKWEAEGLYIPMSCQQCQDAPCMNVCPVKAISRDETLERVMVDYDKCIGCRSCVAVCPFGAMSFDTVDKKVFKCDVCDGDPQCVRFCEEKAVDYVDARELGTLKKRDAARRISIAGKEAAVLLAQA
ncbi:MAG: 4Fe-4S dicluster domain-containing protein [Deltaproteobacteria bacterium]|nr:4Fe-4S dicluster domain-containing protein [Deltaproteobacteria bacterium]MBW1919257.1 4Fe-4S dicluster domain-containing protein [Deltaproteobacteria bacterium]MBW1979113.1 4Fe-4S dicluster domain-containing protein [Deltaproteobacteria bacterium]MBW2045906.1 4Fe-4S dicluster domain-containing protein [Deltaproteobacteria bacterium]MBW2301961.1 4Fe-4S dicluster domain-containing protein [Deltaproteobacteria bacterium]